MSNNLIAKVVMGLRQELFGKFISDGYGMKSGRRQTVFSMTDKHNVREYLT